MHATCDLDLFTLCMRMFYDYKSQRTLTEHVLLRQYHICFLTLITGQRVYR